MLSNSFFVLIFTKRHLHLFHKNFLGYVLINGYHSLTELDNVGRFFW